MLFIFQICFRAFWGTEPNEALDAYSRLVTYYCRLTAPKLS
jgi:hypothetical protein